MTKFVVTGWALIIAGGLQAGVVNDAQGDPQKTNRSSAQSQAAPAVSPDVQGMSYIDALYLRKLGRFTPSEEARLKEERANAAYRAEPALPSLPYIDNFMRVKLGRFTPTEEARLNEERASAAFRAEPARASEPYLDQYMRAKLGRTADR